MEPASPLISIITVNLNNLEGLKRTMTSVFEQTWQEFEYIIIDGGSTDGGKEFIENYGAKIDYWVSEPDTGIYNGMNKGIQVASGEYLLFLNSGDEFYTKTVLEENQFHLYTEDIIYFDIFLIFQDRAVIHNYPEYLNFHTFLKGAIGHPTSFIKKDLFKKIGNYDESLQIVSDWKFFMTAIIKFNCSWKKVNATLSKFYMDGISSNNKSLVIEERKKVLEEDFADYLRLNNLEYFLRQVKKSKTIKFVQWLGFLRFINKID